MNELLYNLMGIGLLCLVIILLCLYFPCIDYINKKVYNKYLEKNKRS